MITNAFKLWGAILIAVLSVYLVNYIYLNLVMKGFMYFFQGIIMTSNSSDFITNIKTYNEFFFTICLLLCICTYIVILIICAVNKLIKGNKFIIVPITIYISYKTIGVFHILFIAFAHALANSFGYSFIFYTWGIIIFLIIMGIYIGGIIGSIKNSK